MEPGTNPAMHSLRFAGYQRKRSPFASALAVGPEAGALAVRLARSNCQNLNASLQKPGERTGPNRATSRGIVSPAAGNALIAVVLAIVLWPVFSSCSGNGSCAGADAGCDAMSSLLLIPFRTRYFIYYGQGTATEARTLDTRSGALGPLSESPFSNTLTGYADPTGRFMYSAQAIAPPNNVRSYTINAYTGTLTPTSSPLASANNYPVYIDFHPNGQFVYAMNYSTLDISAFVIDQSTGNLSKIGDFATSCACGNLAQLRVAPNGKFLYVTGNGGPETITGFSIDQKNGALALIGTTNVGIAGMDAVLVDSTSSYLYAVSSGGTLPGYRIDPNSGALTALPGSPFTGVGGNFRAAMHPTGRFLYTVNILGAQLAWHSIAADGSLSAPATLGFGTNLQYVTIDLTGGFGFVNDGTAPSIFQFSIDQATGAASLISGTPLAIGAVTGSVQVARTRAWP